MSESDIRHCSVSDTSSDIQESDIVAVRKNDISGGQDEDSSSIEVAMLC